MIRVVGRGQGQNDRLYRGVTVPEIVTHAYIHVPCVAIVRCRGEV